MIESFWITAQVTSQMTQTGEGGIPVWEEASTPAPAERTPLGRLPVREILGLGMG